MAEIIEFRRKSDAAKSCDPAPGSDAEIIPLPRRGKDGLNGTAEIFPRPDGSVGFDVNAEARLVFKIMYSHAISTGDIYSEGIRAMAMWDVPATVATAIAEEFEAAGVTVVHAAA